MIRTLAVLALMSCTTVAWAQTPPATGDAPVADAADGEVDTSGDAEASGDAAPSEDIDSSGDAAPSEDAAPSDDAAPTDPAAPTDDAPPADDAEPSKPPATPEPPPPAGTGGTPSPESPPLFYRPPAPSSTSPTEEQPERGDDWRVIFGAVAVGVGGGAIVAGSIVAGVAAARYADLDCPDDACPPDQHEAGGDYNDLRIPAGATIVAGSLLALVGGIFLIYGIGDDRRYVGVGPQGLTLGGSF